MYSSDSGWGCSSVGEDLLNMYSHEFDSQPHIKPGMVVYTVLPALRGQDKKFNNLSTPAQPVEGCPELHAAFINALYPASPPKI